MKKISKYSRTQIENPFRRVNAALIGGGIMSVTLAVLIKKLRPDASVIVFERLPALASESSHALNNAGTGHSGLCELNYDLDKGISTCESFEISKQFWAYLAKEDGLDTEFIHLVPHVSVVKGNEIEFLRKRFETFSKSTLFSDIRFIEDEEQLMSLIPLVMEGSKEQIAATFSTRGTDIDFGKLTIELSEIAKRMGVEFFNVDVETLRKRKAHWKIYGLYKNRHRCTWDAEFVFIGAGGATLNLLEETGIPESRGYGGFPVSGEWLICKNEDVVKRHFVKAYGKPKTGAPPMSTPHLDKRVIDGKESLIFGPFAGFSTKFLKHGSWKDFFRSLTFSNIFTVAESGIRNLPLVWYLFREVTKGKRGRMKELRRFYPLAKKEDWERLVAGQRVQVIKRQNGKAHIEFGTEIVFSKDKTIAALLGASPGASTSVKAMLDVFMGSVLCKKDSSEKIKTIVRSFGSSLESDPEFFRSVSQFTNENLYLSRINRTIKLKDCD
jgi:malate dehydrogenase (quinone)